MKPRGNGHEVNTVDVASLAFPVVRSQEEWNQGSIPSDIQQAQEAIIRADHLLILYPLWMGTMPALLKAFLEQVFRPNFAFREKPNALPEKLLKGKSCRVVVTMGMPGFLYRWYYGAHGIKLLRRNILSFCGIGPIRVSLFGLVESKNPARREGYLKTMRRLGARVK